MGFLDVNAKRIPAKVLSAVLILLAVYVGVLGAVAVWTERDVEFWPPKIGPGPKSRMVDEFKEARLDLKQMKFGAESEIAVLSQKLNDARTKQAESYANNFSDSLAWEKVAKSLEGDIKRKESILLSRFDGFDSYIKSLETLVHNL
ncbi:hypothetical protein [Pseudomonas atacamensis]|uniref:hypothetical protein n=1 Tax=Pseudomonas atacamensis TaxID=2565368 RepID=UPI003208B029